MISNKEFRKFAHQFVDWIADYLENIEEYPVKSQVKPGEVFNLLQDDAPYQGESIENIFEDFKKIILPGITHWQSPNFFAYFPANSSYPSLLAEMLTAAIGTQAMKWVTSPAAAELEEKVMNWLKKLIGIPKDFSGVIQDSASTATLCAILSAREKYSGFEINKKGLYGLSPYKIYCSTETHSSIEKAVKIAGLGSENLRKIAVDQELSMLAVELKETIKNDIENGFKPLCVIAALGTTSTTAIDPIKEISEICKEFNIWLHVDAAYSGTALILPEYQKLIEGIEDVDSFVFNPHKWLFTNFDLSAYFVKEKQWLIRTFEILPEYLKTEPDGQVNNYCDWGVPLGRRFRALKLWFVLRNYGINGIQERLREHIKYASYIDKQIDENKKFQLVVPTKFNLVCFRYIPNADLSLDELNIKNEELLNKLNDSGEMFLSHTKVRGMFIIRMVIAQTYVKMDHVKKAWSTIIKTAETI